MTAPIVFLLIFAIVEFGFMFRDYISLRGAAAESVRAAAIAGNDVSADFRILEVVQGTSGPLPDGAITRVVIFRADTAASTVPPSCLTA